MICIRSYILMVTLTFTDYYYLAQQISSIQRKPETKAINSEIIRLGKLLCTPGVP